MRHLTLDNMTWTIWRPLSLYGYSCEASYATPG